VAVSKSFTFSGSVRERGGGGGRRLSGLPARGKERRVNTSSVPNEKET